MEHRAFQLDVRQTDSDELTFSGYANVFGTVDSFNSRFRQGAFSKTIREHNGRFPLLWFHNPMQPIGMGDFREDDHGLFVEGRLNPDVPKAREVHAGMDHGEIDQMSIGFKAMRDDQDTEDGVREITEVRLFEASPLTRNFAANELALITDVRSMPGMIDYIATMSQQDVDPAELRNEIQRLYDALDRHLTPSRMPTERRDVPASEDFAIHPDRDAEWNGDEAERRARIHASEGNTGAKEDMDWEQYATYFMNRDPDNPEEFGSYKMILVDFFNEDGTRNNEGTGTPEVPLSGLFTIGNILVGGQGGIDEFESGDEERMKDVAETYYAKAREAFDDDEIIAPWKQENGLSLEDIQAAIEADPDLRADVAKLMSSAAPPDPGTRPASTPIADDHLDVLGPELRQLSKQLEGSVD